MKTVRVRPGTRSWRLTNVTAVYSKAVVASEINKVTPSHPDITTFVAASGTVHGLVTGNEQEGTLSRRMIVYNGISKVWRVNPIQYKRSGPGSPNRSRPDIIGFRISAFSPTGSVSLVR